MKRTRTGGSSTFFTLAVAGLLASAGGASAATTVYKVTTTADVVHGSCTTKHCSLRDAVIAADKKGGASTIILPAGTYKLTIKPGGAPDDPATGDLDINKAASVTIVGAGSKSTIINANHIDRAFAVHPGAALAVSKMTIENGSPAAGSSGGQTGGAIYDDGWLSAGADATFQHNTSPKGGGAIAADGIGALHISKATFTGNSSAAGSGGGPGDGAAISDNTSGPTTIAGSAFTANTSDFATVIVTGGPVNISRSALTTNYASGLLLVNNASGIVSRSYIAGNTYRMTTGIPVPLAGGINVFSTSGQLQLVSDVLSDNHGLVGGVFNSPSGPGILSVRKTVIDGNVGPLGGGVLNGGFGSGGPLSIDRSSLTHNAAYPFGGPGSGGESVGGLLQGGAPLSLVNTTISSNSGPVGGLAFSNSNTPTTMVNDTIAFNAVTPYGGPTAGGIYGANNATTSGGASGVLNTIVGENASGDCAGGKFSPAVDRGHNLDSDGTCFSGATDLHANPRLGEPANNGGGVLTDALLRGSPALNSGSNLGCPATDARGVTRPQGPACDIGAYEAIGGKGVAASRSGALDSPAAAGGFGIDGGRLAAIERCAKQPGCAENALAWLRSVVASRG